MIESFLVIRLAPGLLRSGCRAGERTSASQLSRRRLCRLGVPTSRRLLHGIPQGSQRHVQLRSRARQGEIMTSSAVTSSATRCFLERSFVLGAKRCTRLREAALADRHRGSAASYRWELSPASASTSRYPCYLCGTRSHSAIA